MFLTTRWNDSPYSIMLFREGLSVSSISHREVNLFTKIYLINQGGKFDSETRSSWKLDVVCNAAIISTKYGDSNEHISMCVNNISSPWFPSMKIFHDNAERHNYDEYRRIIVCSVRDRSTWSITGKWLIRRSVHSHNANRKRNARIRIRRITYCYGNSSGEGGKGTKTIRNPRVCCLCSTTILHRPSNLSHSPYIKFPILLQYHS